MNYYEPGTAPLEPEHIASLNPGVMRELRRSGFWASFLGWMTVLGVAGVITFSLMAPGLYSQPRSSAPKDDATSMAEVTDQDLAKYRAEREAKAEQILKSQGDNASPASMVGPIIGIIMLLAAVGMIIMLSWFGASTRKILYHPNYKALHHIMVIQRRLWICIGVFCFCSLISTLLFWLGMFSGIGALMAR